MPNLYDLLGDGEEDSGSSNAQPKNKGAVKDKAKKEQAKAKSSGGGGSGGGGGGGRQAKHGGMDRHSGTGRRDNEKRGGKGKYNWGEGGEKVDVSKPDDGDPMGDDRAAPREAEDEGPAGIGYEEYLKAKAEAAPEEDAQINVREATDDFDGGKAAKPLTKEEEQAPWEEGDDESEEKKSKKKKKNKKQTISFAEFAAANPGTPSGGRRERKEGGRDGEGSRRGGRRDGSGRGRNRGATRRDGGDAGMNGDGGDGGRGRGRRGRGRGRGRGGRGGRGRGGDRSRQGDRPRRNRDNRSGGYKSRQVLTDKEFPTLGA